MDCNDAGSQHFSRATESPFPELLISSDAWNTRNIWLHKWEITSEKCINLPTTPALFSRRWIEYADRMAMKTKRTLKHKYVPSFFLFYDINSILFDLIQKEDIYVDLKGFRLESPLYHGQTLAAQTRPHCANNHAVPACQETGSAAYRYVIKFTYYTCIWLFEA